MLRLAPLLAVLLASHAPVVAGPTKSGATLSAHDRKGRLCLELRADRDGTGGESCARPRLTLRGADISGAGSRRRSFLYGTVASEVAAVELVFPGGGRVRAKTTAGEGYHGRYAGKLRFFLAETRLAAARFDEPIYARLLDAEGQLLAAVEQSFGGRRVGPKTTVVRGRVGRTPWSLVAFQRRQFAPLPGNEERLIDVTCTAIDTGQRNIIGGLRAESCDDPDYPSTYLDASIDTECEPIGNAIVGFARPGTRRIVAVLGDGRHQRVPVKRVPRRMGGDPVFALALARRVALRRLVAIDASGRHRVIVSGVAPGVTDCVERTGGGILFAYVTDDDRPTPAGPVAFSVVDRGTLICPSLVGPPRTIDCQPPPLDDWDGAIMSRQVGNATAVAGVMPAQASRVVLRLDGGDRVPLETSLSGPYTGQYAGHLRFFSTLLPGHRRVESIRSLDAQGRSLVVRPGPDEVEPELRPVPLLHLDHGWRLGGATFKLNGKQAPCLQVTGGSFSPSPYACGAGSFHGFADYGVEAPCRPREILLWGMLPRRARSVAAETSLGAIPGRVVPLRRALHVPGRAFVVTVPTRARPTALVFEGARNPRTRLTMPSAAEQCGWTDNVFAQL